MTTETAHELILARPKESPKALAAVPGSCQTTATKRLRRLSGMFYQVVCETR